MTSTINASTTAGIVTTADTSGVLALQTAGTYQQTVTRALYTKIGRQVTLQCFIAMASTVTGGGTGYLQITGVPANVVAHCNTAWTADVVAAYEAAQAERETA